MTMANLFECKHLETIGQNVLDNDPDLNPSIGTYLNDQWGEYAKETLINKGRFSDCSFQIAGNDSIILGHRSLIECRSAPLKKIISESKAGEPITIDGVTEPCFKAIIEFIYTSHAPVKENDPYKLLTSSRRFGVPRLISMCELNIGKVIEKAVVEKIEKADIDIIGILLMAQEEKADQLDAFCLHFLCTNYAAMKKRKEWKLLKGKNLKYV